MKKTIQLRNNKTLTINFEMNMRGYCPDGWEPLTMKKLVMITEVTIRSGQREVKGVYHDDYINLHDVNFYTNLDNTVFYSKAIARLAEQDHEIAYVLKVKDSYVMLTDDECKDFTTALEELREAEAKEKDFYESIKKEKIKDVEVKLQETQNEIKRIENFAGNSELLHDDENKVRKANYRNLMFEGKEGEYPYNPTKETYEYKKKQLAELESKLQEYQAGILFRLSTR